MNNEKINISKSEYNFYLSVNPNKKDILKNKINNQLSKININNLIMLDDDNQYESTVEEIQTTRLLSKDTFCKNIHPDDIDKMFDKAFFIKLPIVSLSNVLKSTSFIAFFKTSGEESINFTISNFVFLLFDIYLYT